MIKCEDEKAFLFNGEDNIIYIDEAKSLKTMIARICIKHSCIIGNTFLNEID